jgi:uncharacterized protein (TIRG00374 family)
VAHADWVLLVVALVLEVFALVGYANLFRFVLRVLDIRLPLHQVMGITLAGLAVSHVFSAGGVGGWVVSYNALRRKNVPHGLVFVAIAAQNFFNYAVLWFVFFIAMVFLVVTGERSIWTYTTAFVLIGLLLALTGYGIYLYNHRTAARRRVNQAARVVNAVARREVIEQDHIDGWLDNFFAGMRRMTSHHGAFRTTTAVACLYWTFDLFCLWATFFAFNYHVPLVFLAIGYVIAYSVGTLAPTPGGLGAIEGLMVALYVGFGVPSATALAVVLTYRVINFWLPIPPGLVSYVAIRQAAERSMTEHKTAAT